MSDIEHHTPEQVAQAFAKAPQILKELRDLGVVYPSFQLYGDASGTLWLGEEPTEEQIKRASELVRSNRFHRKRNTVGIAFCCGLVNHSTE